jgi:hypothetical protein
MGENRTEQEGVKELSRKFSVISIAIGVQDKSAVAAKRCHPLTHGFGVHLEAAGHGQGIFRDISEASWHQRLPYVAPGVGPCRISLDESLLQFLAHFGGYFRLD